MKTGLVKAEAALDDQALRKFVETRGARTRRQRPDLFLMKMRQAASSDFAFFRGMPDLFYHCLSRGPRAAQAARAPELFLCGDIHAENAEIVEHKGLPLPQFNDFDDCGRGPAALDQARLLTGAAFIGNGAKASHAELIAQARQGYLESLRMSFGSWRRSVALEAAVEEGPVFERQWHRHGLPLTNAAFAERLFETTGLKPRRWDVLDRAGSGLSSIGVRRYLFAHVRRPHARELKEVRPAAISLFTGKTSAAQGARVARAFEALRRSPVEARPVAGLGAEWVLRRREGTQRSLALEHAVSAARVLGGLAAQVHKAQCPSKELAGSLSVLDDRAILGLVAEMSAMRAGLSRLVDSGLWQDRPRRRAGARSRELIGRAARPAKAAA